MNRAELLSALKLAAPALATKDLVPALCSFFFDGERLLAFNDQEAVFVPFESKIRGGLPGRVLLEWAAAVPGENVVPTVSKDSVKLVAGKAKWEAALLPLDQIDPPDDGIRPTTDLPATPEFFDALEKVSICLGRDYSILWRLGATIVGNEKGITIYSTNNFMSARARVVAKKIKPFCTIIPPSTVDAILQFRTEPGIEKIGVTKEFLVATLVGGAKLVARLGTERAPQEYEGLFEVDLEAKPAPIPSGVAEGVARLRTVLSTKMNPIIEIVADGEELILKAESQFGEGEERFEFEYPEMALRTDPPSIAAALQGAGEDAKIAGDGEGIFLVSGATVDYLLPSVAEAE